MIGGSDAQSLKKLKSEGVSQLSAARERPGGFGLPLQPSTGREHDQLILLPHMTMSFCGCNFMNKYNQRTGSRMDIRVKSCVPRMFAVPDPGTSAISIDHVRDMAAVGVMA